MIALIQCRGASALGGQYFFKCKCCAQGSITTTCANYCYCCYLLLLLLRLLLLKAYPTVLTEAIVVSPPSSENVQVGSTKKEVGVSGWERSHLKFRGEHVIHCEVNLPQLKVHAKYSLPRWISKSRKRALISKTFSPVEKKWKLLP